MLKIVDSITGNKWFKIFFAVWTGVYLVQVIKGTTHGDPVNELDWILIAFVVAIFIV